MKLMVNKNVFAPTAAKTLAKRDNSKLLIKGRLVGLGSSSFSLYLGRWDTSLSAGLFVLQRACCLW
jgi:hypothetical protein